MVNFPDQLGIFPFARGSQFGILDRFYCLITSSDFDVFLSLIYCCLWEHLEFLLFFSGVSQTTSYGACHGFSCNYDE